MTSSDLPPEPPSDPADDAPLPSEALVAAARAAAEGSPPDRAQAERVKRRLLQRIAATQQHFTAQPQDGIWMPIGPGLECKLLQADDDEQAASSYLLRLAPGAEIPSHRHPVDEECLVLEGDLMVGGVQLVAGSYHMARAGELHQTLRSVTGALLFVRGPLPGFSMMI